MKWIQTLLMVSAAALCVNAFAQWQWINKDGHKVFSDRAPSADIPDKNILKRPAGRLPPSASPTESEATSETALAIPIPASSKPAGGLDKELEVRKKKALETEAAKRKAEDDRVAKARADNCVRAKRAKASLDSGTRLVRTNDAGEREVMDESALAEEQKRTQGIIDRDCK
ncbi:MAG: DUF4124 domain-containing protein [Burkholderiales bacterium]|nr:DUF4124 domain-containing protein [Burkholderiales bacterium]